MHACMAYAFFQALCTLASFSFILSPRFLEGQPCIFSCLQYMTPLDPCGFSQWVKCPQSTSLVVAEPLSSPKTWQVLPPSLTIYCYGPCNFLLRLWPRKLQPQPMIEVALALNAFEVWQSSICQYNHCSFLQKLTWSAAVALLPRLYTDSGSEGIYDV